MGSKSSIYIQVINPFLLAVASFNSMQSSHPIPVLHNVNRKIFAKFSRDHVGYNMTNVS